MDVAPPQRPFTVDEFHRLAEAGVLGHEERVELFDGMVIEMAAIGSRHAASVRRLNRLFSALDAADLVVDVQNPVHIDEHTELVPDVMLLKPQEDFYRAAHPRSDDVLLVIEVADTTVHYDRDSKMRRYGEAGIREAWLVDLPNRLVEVFRGPSPDGGYVESARFSAGEIVESTVVRELAIPVDDILG